MAGQNETVAIFWRLQQRRSWDPESHVQRKTRSTWRRLSRLSFLKNASFMAWLLLNASLLYKTVTDNRNNDIPRRICRGSARRIYERMRASMLTSVQSLVKRQILFAVLRRSFSYFESSFKALWLNKMFCTFNQMYFMFSRKAKSISSRSGCCGQYA